VDLSDYMGKVETSANARRALIKDLPTYTVYKSANAKQKDLRVVEDIFTKASEAKTTKPENFEKLFAEGFAGDNRKALDRLYGKETVDNFITELRKQGKKYATTVVMSKKGKTTGVMNPDSTPAFELLGIPGVGSAVLSGLSVIQKNKELPLNVRESLTNAFVGVDVPKMVKTWEAAKIRYKQLGKGTEEIDRAVKRISRFLTLTSMTYPETNMEGEPTRLRIIGPGGD